MSLRYGVYRFTYGKLVLFLMAAALCFTVFRGAGKSSAVSGTGRKLPIYSVETAEKKVSMGFNCAWDNADITQLIEILGRYKVRATFFVSGSWCKKYPDSVKALYDAGHEIGSHSNTHADLAKLGRDQLLEEITLCNRKIKAIIGKEPELFRMPSGSYNDLVIETIESQGMTAIQWDCDTVDYRNPTPAEMRDRVMDKLRNGSILLLHSGARNTPEALPGLIEAIRGAGYELVPVSDLILPAPYTVDHEGRQHGQ